MRYFILVLLTLAAVSADSNKPYNHTEYNETSRVLQDEQFVLVLGETAGSKLMFNKVMAYGTVAILNFNIFMSGGKTDALSILSYIRMLLYSRYLDVNYSFDIIMMFEVFDGTAPSSNDSTADDSSDSTDSSPEPVYKPLPKNLQDNVDPNFIYNYSGTLYIIAFMILLYLFSFLRQVILWLFKSCISQQRRENFKRRMQKKRNKYSTSILTKLLDSSTDCFFFFIIALLTFIPGSGQIPNLSLAFAFIFTFIAILLLITAFRKIIQYQRLRKDVKDYDELRGQFLGKNYKFEALFEDFKEDNLLTQCGTLVIILREYLYILVILLLNKHMVPQMILLVSINILRIVYLVKVKPYEDRLRTILEVISDGFIIFFNVVIFIGALSQSDRTKPLNKNVQLFIFYSFLTMQVLLFVYYGTKFIIYVLKTIYRLIRKCFRCLRRFRKDHKNEEEAQFEVKCEGEVKNPHFSERNQLTEQSDFMDYKAEKSKEDSSPLEFPEVDLSITKRSSGGSEQEGEDLEQINCVSDSPNNEKNDIEDKENELEEVDNGSSASEEDDIDMMKFDIMVESNIQNLELVEADPKNAEIIIIDNTDFNNENEDKGGNDAEIIKLDIMMDSNIEDLEQGEMTNKSVETSNINITGLNGTVTEDLLSIMLNKY